MAFRPIKTREEFREKRARYVDLMQRVQKRNVKRWTNDRQAMNNTGWALTNYAHRQYVKGYDFRMCAEALPTYYLARQLFECIFQAGRDVQRALADLTFVGPINQV